MTGLCAFAQIPKKVVVEHFTNTKCSICAGRNPGFYSNLNNQQNVLHLAIHPSSPYPACVLSQHNVTENDARTNYYGVYGSTPRLVIQGVAIATSANYSSASIFTPYLNQLSPASIKITQAKYGNDSIRSRVVIKTEGTHTLGALKLFVALAEDTVFYTGSNGESMHFDVFRKSLSGASGIAVTLPATIGDSVVFSMASTANTAWNFSRIFTMAILQDATTREVVQSEMAAAGSDQSVPTGIGITSAATSPIVRFINDNFQKNIAIWEGWQNGNSDFTLYDITGRKLLRETVDSRFKIIAANELTDGIYIYAIRSKEVTLKTGKLLVHP